LSTKQGGADGRGHRRRLVALEGRLRGPSRQGFGFAVRGGAVVVLLPEEELPDAELPEDELPDEPDDELEPEELFPPCE